MSKETVVLLENVSVEAATAGFSYGEKRKGSGYHKSTDGVHTAVFQFNNFIGSVKIQGTLELYPNNTDWVDVEGTTITVEDSSALTTNETRTFIGKFVYIRAAYNIQNGTITEIRYNH
jgi:phosphoribosylformylglycinamidine (FGAM) synthase-like amidotransferase family enzyme